MKHLALHETQRNPMSTSRNPSNMMYPQYTVNGFSFGRDYDTANMYWRLNGGVLLEKLDSRMPWHVLQSKAKETEGR